MACGATVAAAAQKAGIGERTAYRRLNDPQFQKKIVEIRSDLVVRTSSMLSASGGEAVKTLLELQKPAHPPTVRLGASKAILEVGMRLRELAELEQRVAELESRNCQKP